MNHRDREGTILYPHERADAEKACPEPNYADEPTRMPTVGDLLTARIEQLRTELQDLQNIRDAAPFSWVLTQRPGDLARVLNAVKYLR